MSTQTNSAAHDTTEIFIDENGRKGIVTRSPRHAGGVFARPADMAYVQGNLITVTWWTQKADGSFEGIWCDSPFGGDQIKATIEV